MAQKDGDLTLTVNGKTISGWTKMRVTRGIERCPNDFEVELTEIYPAQGEPAVVQPGNPVIVKIGTDVVLTGYVDDYIPSIAAERHEIRITGRGKCGDLVDCSAEWPGGQISGANALVIAQNLAHPYGITAQCLSDPGPQIPQFNIALSQTAYEIIERVCRFAGLLAYEDRNGNLILEQVSPVKAASGAVEGENVQAASFVSSMRERYSAYKAFLISVDTFDDVGSGGNSIGEADDPNVLRHRLKYIVAEAVSGGQDLALKRALWEAARRQGRGLRAIVTVDSWRDAGGALWTPNTLVPIHLPTLKILHQTWTLGDVTFLRDKNGTRSELTLSPSAAFQPEPIMLQPVLAGIQ